MKYSWGFPSQWLDGYHDAHNDPVLPRRSTLAAYLHFGEISPVEVAPKVLNSKTSSNAYKDAFLEELIVRRELAIDHV